jgi:hypothetical protein
VDVRCPCHSAVVASGSTSRVTEFAHLSAIEAGIKPKDRVFDDEIYGWEPDPLEASEECKDGLNRLKLTGQQQILASRVGQLLRRML